ncbi:MAG: AAA family ATPase [Candidatus Magasanikbacteria bacterium]
MDFFEALLIFGILLLLIGILFLLKERMPMLFSSFSFVSSGVKKKGTRANSFLLDITIQASEGDIDPVIGREEEIMRATQILSRRKKNNVILVGDPGVGKTAIVEGLALKIVTGNVPDALKDKKVFVLQLADLIAGTKYRGEFENRVKGLVEQIRASERQIILFIDEIHAITQTKGAEGGINISDILKPALARGELQVVGATTKKEYEEYILPDESWARRFQQISIGEPSITESKNILYGLKKNYEAFHKVIITKQAIDAAVTYSQKYIAGRKLPDKAIDVMDEAAAMVKVYDSTVPDHAGALLFGAAHNISKTRGTETDVVKKLKQELFKLRKGEEKLSDSVALKGVRKRIVEKVKAIEAEESSIRKKNGWPRVTAKHVKEVVADWAEMKLSQID